MQLIKAPLGQPPLPGERGGHPHNSHRELLINSYIEDFSRTKKF